MGGQILKFANRVSRSAWQLPALILAIVGSAFAQLPPNTFVNSKQFNFVYQTGTNPLLQSQTLQVLSDTPRAFTLTPQQVSGPTTGISWLSVNGSASAITGTTNAFVNVGVNPLGLAVGVYSGTLRLEMTGVPAETIVVFLRVSASPQLVIPLSGVNFLGQTGQQTQLIPVNSSSVVSTSYTSSVTQYNPAGGSWLTVSPPTGVSNPAGSLAGNVSLTANLVGLAPGFYYAVVLFRGPDDGDLSLPVSLVVNQSTTVSATPDHVDFAFQASNLSGSSNVKSLAVVGSGGAALAYQASITGDSRITISKTPGGVGGTLVTGTTPETLYVKVDQAGLVAGASPAATITIATTQNTVTVPVKVTVTNQPLIFANPESLTFSHTLGSTLQTGKTIDVTGTSVLGYTVTEAEVSGGDWLTVTPTQGFTPSQLAVSLNATRVPQLPAGTYTANITINTPAAANTSLVVPVTLTVSGSTLLTVDKSNLDFSGQVGGPAVSNQTFTVQSTDNTSQNYTLRIDPASPWLFLDKTSSSTGPFGDIVTVTADITKVTAAGKLEADIIVTPVSTAVGAVGQKVHVTFNVTSSTAVTATPARIDATQTGATPPAGVSVRIASSGAPVGFTARADAPWLSVAPVQGTTPQDLGVSFTSGSLAPGTYDSSITILPPGSTPLTIPVRLVVQSGATLGLSQSSASISYSQGASLPAGVVVGLTSSGTAINFTAAATTASGGNWLSVAPASGATGPAGSPPTNITITSNATGLAPGTYTGAVTVTSAGASNSPQTIAVTLVVTAATPPVLREIQNAARNEQTLVVPGMIVALKGTNLGPTTGVSGRVTNGVVDTTVSDVRVLFDGVAAPILFARQDQINTVAPYGLFGRTTTRIQVEYRGLRSDAAEYRVLDTTPGIFTQDSTGRGPGAILNQNNTTNTSNNPARRGEVIVIYATGEGQVRPAGTDGRITTGTVDSLPRPILPVVVKLAGVPVPAENVTYAGAAPGLVAGAMQVNVKIPDNLNITGLTAVPVEVQVAQTNSQPGVTVAVIP